MSLFFKIFIVIQLQLYAFSPHPSTPPQLNPPPSLTSTLPLDFVHVSFIVVPVRKHVLFIFVSLQSSNVSSTKGTFLERMIDILENHVLPWPMARLVGGALS